MPFFSVVIPTHNRASLLREALESVFAQEFADYEVIVVDDGSTDNTAKVAAAYGDRIRFLRRTNAGPGAARDLGLKHATGRYVAFLDSDDVWFPWTLSSYWRVIDACYEPAFVCGECIRFTRADEIKAVRPAEPTYETFVDYYAARPQNIWIGTCGVAVRADVLVRTGGFPEGFINAEDSDLWMNLGTAPGFVHLKAPIVFGYRANPESASKVQSRTFEGIRQMVLKEQTGKYPGGLARQRERWHILTAHVRPASLDCLRSKHFQSAWWLYRNTFRWHLAESRLKYLLGFWLFALRGALARGPHRNEKARHG